MHRPLRPPAPKGPKRRARGPSKPIATVREGSERFRSELQIWANLSHPNLLPLLDCGEKEGQLYAVFGPVSGETLEQALAREGARGVSESLHLMSQVLDALAAAHARGIVHRNLTPSNIVLSGAGARRNALVLNFGLGGLAEKPGERKLAGGTPTSRSNLHAWGLIAPGMPDGSPRLRRRGQRVAAAGRGRLVYFGYPHAHEDDAERAVRAALEVVREVGALDVEAAGGLSARVGIHTGLVVVGDPAARDRREQVALGAAPNIAARLQGLADPGMVLISDTTLRRVAGLFELKDLSTPELKGIREPVRVLAVLRPSGVRSPLDRSPRLTPFVGRE